MNAPPRRQAAWTIPALLALITMAGLLSALLGERMAWKIAAWLMLVVPIAVGLWFACLKPRTR